MKFKKVLSWLTATIMMLSASVAVASAAAADSGSASDSTSASDSASGDTDNTPAYVGEVESGDGIYEVYTGYAKLVDVKDDAKESFSLAATVRSNGQEVKVTSVSASAFKGTDIKRFSVRDGSSFRAVDGVLYSFVKVDKDGKVGEGDDYKYFKDTLVAYPPAGAGEFTLPLTVAAVNSDAFSIAPKLTVKVPSNHSNLLPSTDGDLVEYRTVKGEATISNGVVSTPSKTEIVGTIYSHNDNLKFVGGASATSSGSTSTSTSTSGDAAAPQTGAAGAGVALAALLATGSTAVVLKKRGRK